VAGHREGTRRRQVNLYFGSDSVTSFDGASLAMHQS
jgi:hypothetical protein